MSETVHYIGKLTLVPIEEDIQNTAKIILQEEGWSLEGYSDSLEALDGRGYRKYVIYNGNIYRVDMKEYDPYANIGIAFKKDDGTIDFEVRYHNGGCSFSEAIEDALRKI